jgi:hypothetical protein
MRTVLPRIKRFLVLVQTGWSIVGITLVVLILTEAGFRSAFGLKDWLAAGPRPDRRVLAEGYGGATWPVRHYRELEELADRWEPYVYFRQRPFQGKTISISSDGLRQTWQPSPPTLSNPIERKPVEILMLGGSSLWGFGARDDQTIPSLLARELFERGWDVRVRNLSEIGYVSTQEVIALLREIQLGYRPDIVIFYDGVNDTTSAYLEGTAGVTTNEVNRRNEFNLSHSPARLATALLASLIGNSGSYRFAQAIRWRLNREANTPALRSAPGSLGSIGFTVVDRYEANVSIVERLGREFGFRTLFYWQPVVFDKTIMVPFEREEAGKYAWAQPMFRDVYQGIRASKTLRNDPAFHDLSGIFAETQGLVFIDYCHTTETANLRIAAAITDDLATVLRSNRPQDRKPSKGDGGPGPTAVE